MFEGVHPVEGGHLRYKVRTQRRPTFPLESPLTFYPKRAWEHLRTTGRWLKFFWQLRAMAKRIEADPDKRAYTDLALTKTEGEEEQALEILQVHGETANSLQRANIALKGSEQAAEAAKPGKVAAAE
jgi:hypothetical protein